MNLYTNFKICVSLVFVACFSSKMFGMDELLKQVRKNSAQVARNKKEAAEDMKYLHELFKKAQEKKEEEKEEEN